ncbi:MAG: transporter substrate-binding domain-containing protein [Desulfovibrionaceae bacterium]
MKRLLISIMLLAALALPAQAESLLFVTEAGYAPYSFDGDGAVRGLDVELFRELAKRLELDVRVETRPRAEMLRMLERGECHGAFALGFTLQREGFAVFARKQPLHVNSYDLFSSTGRRLAYAGPESLADRRVALPEGVVLEPELAEAALRGVVSFRTCLDEAEAVRLLLQGEVEAFVGQTRATYDLLTKMGMTSTVVASGRKLGHDGGYVALSRRAGWENPEAMARLMELLLSDMVVDGTYRKVEARYIQ